MNKLKFFIIVLLFFPIRLFSADVDFGAEFGEIWITNTLNDTNLTISVKYANLKVQNLDLESKKTIIISMLSSGKILEWIQYPVGDSEFRLVTFDDLGKKFNGISNHGVVQLFLKNGLKKNIVLESTDEPLECSSSEKKQSEEDLVEAE